MVFAEAAGRDGLDIRLDLFDIRCRLVRPSRGQQTVQHIQVVAHIVLIDGGLGLQPVKGVHLGLGLLQLRLQHGALHLRVGAPL